MKTLQKKCFNHWSRNFFYLDGDVVHKPGDFRLLPFQMCWNSWNSFSGDDLIRIRSKLLNIETFDSKLANLDEYQHCYDHLSWVMIWVMIMMKKMLQIIFTGIDYNYECTLIIYHHLLLWCDCMTMEKLWSWCPKSYRQLNVVKRGLGTRFPLRPPLVASGPLLGFQSLRND